MTQNKALDDLLQLMSRLREPDYGCPWDLAQSYQSIAPSTLEEAYEVVDAIEKNDLIQLKDELGDLLFQVVFYCQLAREEERFDFDDVARGITEKLLRRHPHVFPEGTLDSRISALNNNESPDSSEEQNKRIEEQNKRIKASWEKIKLAERQQKGQHSLMDDVPTALPATVRAYKLQKRAASVNFDWSDSSGVEAKLIEELDELKTAVEAQQGQAAIEEELGDVFFTLINLARHYKLEPESSLRLANNKFEARFKLLEKIAIEKGLKIEEQSPETLELWWQQVKQQP